MSWFYWDISFHITEIDKLTHFLFPFFGVIFLSSLFWWLQWKKFNWFKLKFRSIRWAVIITILASLIVEAIQCWIVHTDRVSGGDLISDGGGIGVACLCIYWLKKVIKGI